MATLEQIYDLYLKHHAVCTDTRKISPGCIFFALKGGNFNGNQFAKQAIEAGAAFAVIDEAEYQESSKYLLVEDVLTTLQQLGQHHRKQLGLPVLGITGSNGKTTSKELAHAVLNSHFKTFATAGNFNNHIGVPLSLLSITSDHELAIIEMGANHQGEIQQLSHFSNPNVGFITNIGSAHLEGFGGLDGVRKGKTELYRHIGANDGLLLVNENDDLLVKESRPYQRKFYGTDTMEVTDVEVAPFLSFKVAGELIQTQLVGAYNLPNMLAAIAAGDHFGVPREKAYQALRDYRPENQRSQLMEKNGVSIILDAYNANPVSMGAALDNLAMAKAESKFAILGDMLELGDASNEEHQKMVDKVAASGINKAWFVGPLFSAVAYRRGFEYLNNVEEVIDALKTKDIGTPLVLIKGSRGIKLEKALEGF